MKKFILGAWFLLLCAGGTAYGQVHGLNSPKRIAGEYIVVFKKNADKDGPSFHAENVERISNLTKGFIGRQFRYALSGAMFYGDQGDAEVVAADPAVKFVEANSIVKLSAVQDSPPWGLDRIDQASGLDNSYSYDFTGSGVHAYVVDTGVFSSHQELMDRMGEGTSTVSDTDTEDCHGHGTHVAATIGGTEYGVAKDVIVHPVRVLNCGGSGSWETVVAGIDWVAEHHIAPAVANMSLGGGYSLAVNNAVAGAVAAGVNFVVAAGNDSSNACTYSPASSFQAITVGATDKNDRRASFSNYGGCVDIFAPGVGIKSAWIGGESETRTISGTSMASPHVAGVVATYLEAHPDESPEQMRARVIENASADKVNDVRYKSPNMLVYSAPTGSRNPDVKAPLPLNPCGVDCTFASGKLASDQVVLWEGRLGKEESLSLKAHLRSPLGADFDLELQKHRGFFRGFRKLQLSDKVKDDDVIEREIAEEGRYRIIVKRYFGSGEYKFWYKSNEGN